MQALRDGIQLKARVVVCQLMEREAAEVTKTSEDKSRVTRGPMITASQRVAQVLQRIEGVVVVGGREGCCVISVESEFPFCATVSR